MHLYLLCCSSVFLDDLKGIVEISVLWFTCYGFSFGITWDIPSQVFEEVVLPKDHTVLLLITH